MKRYIVAILLLAVAVLAPPVGTGQFSKVNSATGTPVALTNAVTQVKEVVFLGKSAPRVDNVGDVYIGWASGNDTQPFKIAPGGEAVIRVENPERFIDLSGIYLDVTTANDGVTVIYR